MIVNEAEKAEAATECVMLCPLDKYHLHHFYFSVSFMDKVQHYVETRTHPHELRTI